MLSIVSTPIGNLKDITLRALEVLGACDYVLCEDTRRSKILLDHYKIQKPLKSFYKFNERKIEDRVLSDLQEGKHLALISDAGTPLISDPGLFLVKRCHEEGLPVEVIPGACSVIAALTLSGALSSSFQFLGFLPKKHTLLHETLEGALYYPGVTVFFESPERLCKTLKILQELDPNAKVSILRELTKKHEECLQNSVEAILQHFKAHPPKGEMILIVEGGKKKELYKELSPKELVFQLKKEGLSLKEAIKQAATLKGVDKKALYKEVHEDKILRY